MKKAGLPSGKGHERQELDRYETPEEVTKALLSVESFDGTVHEPCAGTGRMVRVLEEAGLNVTWDDYAFGLDFLEDDEVHDNCVTNPPYNDNLPELYARRQLEGGLFRRKLALLVGLPWLGSRRRYDLFNVHPPSRVYVLDPRVKFWVDGTQRPQAYEHTWIIWDRHDAHLGKTELSWLKWK